ncbi:MAG: potassium transporter [Gammaproteobacteria bacterium]|nr:MAG: potassium transporter [Gammaproteobacteria bacterium]
MHFFSIQRVFGALLLIFSVTQIPPALLAFFTKDGSTSAFVSAYLITLIMGLLLWFPVRRRKDELGTREGFLIVALFWVILALAGALPLYLAPQPHLSVTDAVFESMSGLTTTGATIMVGIDELPLSIRYYRQQLQWLGGMGIIVLAVAVLPMLGIGGMQLYKAEIAGPVKNSKLTARITETAKALWYIYLGLTVLCGVSYWIAGMTPFDAVCHAFSTVAIGGFSTHDASLGWFDSQAIETVAILFMLVAGINFSLHFFALREMSLRPYLADAEVRAYLFILSVVVSITVCYLYITDVVASWAEAIRLGLFQTISIGTTTGFAITPHHEWPGALPILLLLVAFVGGCAGSTAGGIKVIRALLLYRQGVREVIKVVHPNAVIVVKVGREVLPTRVIESVWGFFSVYVAVFVFMYLLLATTEPDLVTAFSAVAACITNLGPGLGEVGTNFSSVSEVGKWVLCMAMLLGRLEVFTLLVLFTPTFWRQ